MKTVDLINGLTETLCVIGDPVSHTISPQIHNTLSAMTGMNVAYVPFRVKHENLGDTIKGAAALGIKGINVTVPHKKAVIPFACEVNEAAAQIGAVNTLKLTENGYAGFNTDYLGIMDTFKYNNTTAKNKKALIIGAGGSANAACYALYKMGAEKIFIANRTLESAKILANNAKRIYNVNSEAMTLADAGGFSDADIIIQTTTVGFSDNAESSPVSGESVFRNAQFVLDAIYYPWETIFLKTARKYCNGVNGFEMLIYQAVAAYEIFMDTAIPENMKIMLRNTLGEYYSRSIGLSD